MDFAVRTIILGPRALERIPLCQEKWKRTDMVAAGILPAVEPGFQPGGEER